ncbi:MAG TPA: peptidyl-prolyl cis-trans isomerase [Fimbriimonas sp.]|nr:peptidyl-prolyl cis-trans isomerase [Fimbriimonas sp.]
MQLQKLLKTLLFATLALVAVGAQAQGDPNAVFATVNGDDIKAGEFWHKLAWFRLDTQGKFANLPAGFLAINELITERIVFQLARSKGVSPSEPEIAAKVKEEEAASPNLLSELKADGRPESDLYDEAKYQLAQFKLRSFGITITDQEIEKHYHDYPSEFTLPERYKLRVIVVQDDQTQSDVDKALSAGKAFAEVAKEYSLDVSKASGGEFGTVTQAQLGKPALAAIKTVKIGQSTGWVTGASGSTVRVRYLVEDVLPPVVAPLDAALRRRIRESMSLIKGDVRNDVPKDIRSALVSAKVSINQTGFQKRFDEMVKQYAVETPSQ